MSNNYLLLIEKIAQLKDGFSAKIIENENKIKVLEVIQQKNNTNINEKIKELFTYDSSVNFLIDFNKIRTKTL